MHFTRLRLHGFKSFVESTDLLIQPGMTGIVGPNGCGKSNLVEALRWVMGETSAKKMRGAEMDDVIFAGTTTRPSRNLAEVMLTLDNTDRSATAEYNDADELTVLRRIERGSGSDYRLNGKSTRQHDIKLLFADQATGAHSTSVVGQGQIDALIRAKPQDRRQILEEASGTAGLQARRHEAELKLKAAEQNLTRVDDVLRTLDTQLRGLKQQVKQASRYRNLAEHIRRTEAALLHLRWAEAEDNAAKTREALQAAEQRANDLLSVVTQGNTVRTESAAELPSLRQAEATAAAIVQKLTLAREQLEAESRRITGEIQAQDQRLSHARADSERERARHHDGETALARLGEEQTHLATRREDIAASLPTITASLETTSAEVVALDSELAKLVEAAAQAEARQRSLQQEIQSLAQRQTVLTTRRAQIDAQRVELAAEIAARPDLTLSSAMVDACETELAKRQQQSLDAEQARRDSEHAQNAQRDLVQEAQANVTKLKAEADALNKMLQPHDQKTEQVIDLITVTPGLESALAVALGEALTAALDSNAAMYWRDLPPLEGAPPLPSSAAPLGAFLKAPPALARSLSQIGLVDNKTQGEEAVGALRVGQILVSRDGWAWRWDGFTLSPEAKTAAAVRLQQRNRLTALQSELLAAEGKAQEAKAALDVSTTLLNQCRTLDAQTREALQAAFRALNDARNLHAKQEREASTATTKMATLDETLLQLSSDLDQLRVRATTVEEEIAAIPPLDALRAAIDAKRLVLAESRGRQAQQRSEQDRLTREQQLCATRQQAITRELQDWHDRMASASAQSAALRERIAEIEAQLADLRAKPAAIEQTRGQLLTDLSEAESRRREAANVLIAAEQKLSVIEHQLKQDETALNHAREERVRAQAAVEAADAHFGTLRERITEKLNCNPEDLRPLAELPEGENWPSPFELEQNLGRYVRERDNMGPVNLRAEVEAETAQNEINRLQQDKDDLVAAIAKLRQAIGQLNREARERLQGAFGLVNERFQILFQKLFGGGKAHLELIDNEDPLNAGLEIFASPPGKKLQILSLLSGGERTLTALALLFAVFQTNPSPICVLDEAEAALDESNIGRFCELVEAIARETGTRFLIITHQRLTMARMDRLYGVTMSEKGVSQLVSVDLASAVALRDGEKMEHLTKAETALGDVRAA